MSIWRYRNVCVLLHMYKTDTALFEIIAIDNLFNHHIIQLTTIVYLKFISCDRSERVNNPSCAPCKGSVILKSMSNDSRREMFAVCGSSFKFSLEFRLNSKSEQVFNL